MDHYPASHTYKRPIFISAMGVLVLSLLVSTGWFADIDVLKSIGPGLPSMKFNTALSFFLLSIFQIWLVIKKKKLQYSWLLPGVIIVHSILVLLEYTLNFSLGIDEFFITDTGAKRTAVLNAFPGRMSPITAVCFILMATGYLLIGHPKTIIKKTAQYLFHFVTLISFIAIIGYLTDVDRLYKVSVYTSIALHTSIAFFVLSVSSSLIQPQLGLTGLFTGTKPGNLVTQKLVPRILIITFLLTYLHLIAYKKNWIGVDFDAALFGLSFILTFLIVALYTSYEINKIEDEKKKAEDKLSLISEFLDASPDPLLIVDTTGTIRFVSKETEQKFGYTKEELLNTNVSILLPERFRTHHAHFINSFFSKPEKRPMSTGRVLYASTKNKIEIPVEISLNPVRLENELVVAAAIRDITEQIKTAEMLNRINELNSIFIKEAPSAIAMFDTEMKYVAASNKWISDYHLGDIEVTGRSHYEIFPEISEEWKQIHRECLAGAINKCDEASFERKDGLLQWLSWDVRPWYKADRSIGGIIMLTIDLTEQKERLLEKQRFETILDKTSSLSQIGAWEMNLRTGVVYWSRAVREMLEAESDFAPNIQSALSMYSLGESRDRIDTALKLAMGKGENFDLETEIVTLKGKTIHARLIGQAEFSNNRLTQLYGIVQNLEPIKKTENELKALLELTTDQNSRLKNFAQIVSHNLRSHTGNINTLLKLLLRKKPELNDLEIIQHIVTASEHLGETVSNLNDIVTMNYSTADHITAVQLKQVLEKCIGLTNHLAHSQHVRIINEVEEGLVIQGVPAYVESILLNFLTNGIKYKSTERSSYIKFFANRTDKFIILFVEDNGIGIDLTRHGEKIFGMYKTFHGNIDARGLGLFMSKNQLETMGGRIEVESKLNEGTTFKLHFLNYEQVSNSRRS